MRDPQTKKMFVAPAKKSNPSLLGYLWIVPIALLCFGMPYLEAQQQNARELKQAQKIRDTVNEHQASQLQQERDWQAKLPEVYIFSYVPGGGPIRPGFRYEEGKGINTGNRDAVWAQQDTVAGVQKSIWTEQGDASVLPDAYKCNFLPNCSPIAEDASGDTIYTSYSPDSNVRIYGLVKGKSIIRIGSPYPLNTSDVIAVANSLRLATPAERQQVWF
jgi:hypothetical protein